MAVERRKSVSEICMPPPRERLLHPKFISEIKPPRYDVMGKVDKKKPKPGECHCDGACGCDEDTCGYQVSWLKYDRQVLRFFCWFQEPVDERPEENYRLRRCTIYYYLEDGTMQIIEPKQRDSGLLQGAFLKRHRITKHPETTEPITIEDLKLGQNIHMYGITFRICQCDPFTRRYMLKHGYDLGTEEAFPGEPIEAWKKSLEHHLIPYIYSTARQQFLDNDGNVLRFYCIWDDRESLYGECRPYVLHYFLGDDTIEICEVNERNRGADHHAMLLNRCRLPQETPQGIIGPHLVAPKPKSMFYHESDLHVGSYIKVYGRDMLIHDCDDYTRNYYMKKWNVSKEMLEPVFVQEVPPVLARPAVPPHNGWGRTEDSLMNVTHLVPRAPYIDWDKWMNNDGKCLSFLAKMIDDEEHKLEPSNMNRFMILQFHLGDDTMAVFDPPVRNSGIVGGRFLHKVQATFKPGTNKRYVASDMYVGAIINLHDRMFELYQADEYTLNWMAMRPKEFPKASFEAVMEKIKTCIRNMTNEELEEMHKMFPEDRTGLTTLIPVAHIMREAKIDLVVHEYITLEKHFNGNKDKLFEHLYNTVQELRFSRGG